MAHTLNTFVRNFCSNFYEDSCILSEKCSIMEGEPCKYFERSVYPECDPAYPYATEVSSNHKVLSDYRKIKKNFRGLSKSDIRTCECGRALARRRRFCDECREKHRKNSMKSKKRS